VTHESAPWPHRVLDGRGPRAAGHRPTPFRQFVLKVHSRCNLACDYCYVYRGPDQSWRAQPTRMDRRVLRRTIERVAEHASAHELPRVHIVLHGGEPLLAGAGLVADLATLARASIGATVDLSVQTNGVLLTEDLLGCLTTHRVRVGVSVDGGATATDRHRSHPSGRGAYAAVARSLRLLRQERFRRSYGGILATVDLANDPIETYESLLAFQPPAIDLLLPHGTWSAPPPGRDPGSAATPYADWLLAVFDRWYSAPVQETSIRLFDEIIQGLLGGSGRTELIGLRPSTLVVVDTDGAIKQVDSLSMAYHGAADMGLNVLDHAFEAALEHPTTVARQLGADALAPECAACSVRQVCGGGFYPHRYRAGAGFRNPSVYCPDLLQTITRIRHRLRADLSAIPAAARRPAGSERLDVDVDA
jgi:uncharacterized protein